MMQVHGYTSIGAIDATIDAVRLIVPDDPANRHRQMIAGWEGQGNTIPAYVPPPPPPYRVYKSTFVSRMDEAEIEQMAARLATENVKYREMYAACDYFISDDPLFAVLHWTVVAELGEPRADELLAPET